MLTRLLSGVRYSVASRFVTFIVVLKVTTMFLLRVSFFKASFLRDDGNLPPPSFIPTHFRFNFKLGDVRVRLRLIFICCTCVHFMTEILTKGIDSLKMDGCHSVWTHAVLDPGYEFMTSALNKTGRSVENPLGNQESARGH